MRSSPLILLACIFCCVAAAPAWAQQIHCSPCGHGFGKVDVGSSATFSIQLSNIGSKTLTISAKSDNAKAFSLGSFPIPMKLTPGASALLPIIFKPTARGYSDAVVTITSNDPHSPLHMNVHGTGLYPSDTTLNISPTTLNFGNVTVGSNSSLQATLTASNGSVTISSDQSTSSEFAIVGITLPVTLSSGQSLPVTIQFTPNASGQATAKAGFTSNATNSPTIEQLTGTGVAQQSHYVSLSWDSGDGSAVGYNVYRGTTQGGPYQEINTALDASTNYTDNTVVSGATYYYVATEVNAQGQESGYSNIGMAKIPTP
jgi:Abnormal spindle-like microcephaly-assoc'd, ASPM-SPD-2-Hydin